MFASTVDRYRSRKIFVKILEVRSERHLRERMVFATSSISKSEQAWQSRTCLLCCIKVQKVRIKDKPLSVAHLLHELIEPFFIFREEPIALTADIESTFLQVQVPEIEVA